MHFRIIALLGMFFITSYNQSTYPICAIDDFSQLNKTDIEALLTPASYDELVAIVKDASAKKKKISLAGMRHSQGGHISYPSGLVISLEKLNNIVHFDQAKNLITVQAGIHWFEVQEFLNSHNLALKIMQFANLFTVGGSLSVNANGIDPHYGLLIESIISIKILLADGSIIKASREENTELFILAIGGYGLFGIILEATLQVVDNDLYRRTSEIVSLDEYKEFLKNLKNHPDIGFHFAWLRLTPGSKKKLFSDILSINFIKLPEDSISKITKKRCRNLTREIFPELKKFEIYCLRESPLIKSIQWIPEVLKDGRIISRNNIMSPPASHVFCESSTITQLLQEYFIPIAHLDHFICSLEYITKKLRINVLHVEFRLVSKNIESFLSYAHEDCAGIVIMLSHKISAKQQDQVKKWTQYLIDQVTSCGGTYYLPIQLHATHEQIHAAYPQINDFFAYKRKYDPQELFNNHFYMKYA